MRAGYLVSLSLLVLSASVLGAGACARDHTLGVTGSQAGTTGGGAPGTSSSESSSAAAGGGEGGGGSTTAASGGQTPPTGPTKLTILNGVNDYEAVRICFLPYPDSDPAIMPWPSAAEGLPFARAARVDPIDATVPPGKDIRPVVLAGDLAQIADKTCADAIALAKAGPGDGGASGGDADGGVLDGGDGGQSPPPLIAAELSVLPASVFDSKRSILLAPMGCLGGPGHDGPSATLACGFGYSLTSPTVSLVAVGMSKPADKSHLSLQAVNAAAALQPSDVRIVSGFDNAAEWPVASTLLSATIGPSPPYHMVFAKDLGPIEKVLIRTYLPDQSFATSSSQLSEALDHGGLTKAAVANGAALVLVAVGAYPGIAAGPFWHKLTFTLIKADP